MGATQEQWGALEEFATKKVTGLSEQRNRAIHDVWHLTNPKTPIRFEATANRVVRYLTIHVPTADLARLAQNIDNLSVEFDILANDIFLSLHPSPDTGPQDFPG